VGVSVFGGELFDATLFWPTDSFGALEIPFPDFAFPEEGSRLLMLIAIWH
jgi:hypothetical protein